MTSFLISTSLIAFLSSVIGGYFPIKNSSRKHGRWMHHMDSFCDGMFLAIATTHFLPEIIEHSGSIYSASLYIAIALGLAILIQLPKKPGSATSWITVLLFAHCLVEGIAVTVVTDTSVQATLSLAILAHKSVESFVFFNLISRQNWSTRCLVGLLLVFSLLTPLGIVIGEHMTSFPDSAVLLINALTCGTFLGISVNCFLLNSCGEHKHHGILWAALGFAALTLIMSMAGGNCCH